MMLAGAVVHTHMIGEITDKFMISIASGDYRTRILSHITLL